LVTLIFSELQPSRLKSTPTNFVKEKFSSRKCALKSVKAGFWRWKIIFTEDENLFVALKALRDLAALKMLRSYRSGKIFWRLGRTGRTIIFKGELPDIQGKGRKC